MPANFAEYLEAIPTMTSTELNAYTYSNSPIVAALAEQELNRRYNAFKTYKNLPRRVLTKRQLLPN